MKKYIRIFTLVLIGAMSFACTRFDEKKIGARTEWISFSTGDGIVATGEVDTRALENEITCDIIDWEYVDEDGTRASLIEDLSGEAGIFGYNFSSWSSSVKPNVMYNMKGTFDEDLLTTEAKVLWKSCTSGKVKFFAYAPYGCYTAISGQNDGGVPFITVTNPTDNSAQKDILYAESEEVADSKREAVPLSFGHAMAAVQFRIGIDGATIKEVTVSGVRNSGRLNLDGTWQDQSGTASYKVTAADELLIMVPQTVPSGATVTLKYNDGSDHTISAGIAGEEWVPGKKMIYTLKKSGSSEKYYYFDLALGNVILTAREGQECKGYIWVGGASGSKQEVSVKHKNTNKYYIYTSVERDDEYTQKIKRTVTGVTSIAQWKTGTGCKVPEYWKEFLPTKSSEPDLPIITDFGKWITNNPNAYLVRKAWGWSDQRYSTVNRILVCGDENTPTDFDITIDNVFSKFFPYKTSGVAGVSFASSNGYDKYGALTIGEDDPDIRNKDFKNYHTERVTLRLKNDNFLGRINYTKPCDSDVAPFPGCHEAHTGDGRSFLKITSADGDGIAKGTLTVAIDHSLADSKIDYSLCSLIGCGNSNVKVDGVDEPELPDGAGMVSRQMTDFFIDGGIVYVGMKQFAESQWTNNHFLFGCIGGLNSESHITVNGGILTAVSNGSCPAIGGGGGWQDKGGKGVVTINGGEVYAYSFGVKGTYNSKSSIIASTAIGGGSTMGENDGATGAPGVVTINGGIVYAQSTGGTAIGGGSSGCHGGGRSEIYINGGKIVAKSISGTVGDVAVGAGTAIGGGRAGYSDGDGGIAKMAVSGGNLQAGSVGGGKCDNATGKIGSADITITGGTTSAQFIMAKGADEDPKFVMSNGVLSGSSTSDATFEKVNVNGGAVYIESGSCEIKGGTISKCSAEKGGAVYMQGGSFTMKGGTISKCRSTYDGGAVYIEGGDVAVNGGVITNNIASSGNGGGVYISGGNFLMAIDGSGRIINNAADANPSTFTGGNGGGIYVRSVEKDVTVDILGGQVQYNAADRNGGGLCVDMTGSTRKASITIGTVGGIAANPDIQYNSAALSGGGMAVEGSGSNIVINSGTVKGNVSAFVKNEDIRNDGGTVELIGKNVPGQPAQVDVKYNTIKFYANNGRDPEDYDEQRVITSTNSPLRPTDKALNFEKEFYHIQKWNTRRDGTGKDYQIDGGGAIMNITEDVSLYAQWEPNE